MSRRGVVAATVGVVAPVCGNRFCTPSALCARDRPPRLALAAGCLDTVCVCVCVRECGCVCVNDAYIPTGELE